MTDPQPPVPPVPSPADSVPPPPAPPVPPAGAMPPVAPAEPAPSAYPAYGQPAQGYYAPPTNSLAIIAMVLSLAGLIVGITAIVGAILGHISLGQIKRTGEGGRGFALTAIIVGWVLVGLGVLAGIILIAVWAYTLSTYGDVYGSY